MVKSSWTALWTSEVRPRCAADLFSDRWGVAMAKVRSELKGTAYEIFIGVLSILSILNLFLLILVHDDRSTQCSMR